MILNVLFIGLMGIIKVVFDALPDLPDVPEAMTEALNWFFQNLAAMTSVLNMIFTTELMTAFIASMLALTFFDQIYWTARYILRKIPYINIS